MVVETIHTGSPIILLRNAARKLNASRKTETLYRALRKKESLSYQALDIASDPWW
jgi:hypothetical protein